MKLCLSIINSNINILDIVNVDRVGKAEKKLFEEYYGSSKFVRINCESYFLQIALNNIYLLIITITLIIFILVRSIIKKNIQNIIIILSLVLIGFVHNIMENPATYIIISMILTNNLQFKKI